jgi:hypothetical protein
MPIIITTSYGTQIPGLDIERIYIEEGLRTMNANDTVKNAYLSLYDTINDIINDNHVEVSINSPTYKYIKQQLSDPFKDLKVHDSENSVNDLIKYLIDTQILELIIGALIPKSNEYLLKKCINWINQIIGRKKILIKI